MFYCRLKSCVCAPVSGLPESRLPVRQGGRAGACTGMSDRLLPPPPTSERGVQIHRSLDITTAGVLEARGLSRGTSDSRQWCDSSLDPDSWIR